MKDMKWETYVVKMRARFHDTQYANLMVDLVSLKQLNIVEYYYDEFEALLNLLQLSE